jgi:flagellar biosynthetic protein FliR
VTVALGANDVSVFLLVLARVSGLVLSAPVIGDRQVPAMIKAGLAIVLGIVLVQVPAIHAMPAPIAMLPFAASVLAQLLVGIVMGYVARTMFFALQIAGGIVSLQTGLSLGAVLNPLTQEPDAVFSQLYTVIASLTFLALQGDLWVVASLARSFDLTPLTPDALTPALVQGAIADVLTVVQAGLQIAMPIAASLFATNLVLGVISRSLPQLNLFVLSLPINLLLGLVALLGSLASVVLIAGHLTGNVPGSLLNLLQHQP